MKLFEKLNSFKICKCPPLKLTVKFDIESCHVFVIMIRYYEEYLAVHTLKRIITKNCKKKDTEKYVLAFLWLL